MATNVDYFEEDIIKGKAYDARLIKRLLPFVYPYWHYLIIAGFMLIISSICTLLSPYVIKIGIDNYIMLDDYKGLLKIALIFLAILMGEFGGVYGQEYLFRYIGQKVMEDLRVRLYIHLQKQSLAFFDKNPVGRLLTRLTNDVQNLSDLFSTGIVMLLGDFTMLVGIMGIMLWMNWKLSLVSFTILPFLVLAVSIFRRNIRESFRLIRQRIAKINSYLQENINGIRDIQLFNRQKKNFDHFDSLNKDFLKAMLDAIFYFAIFFPLMELFSAIAIALIIWYGGGKILAGSLSFGALVAFIQYSQKFWRPLMDISEKYTVLQDAISSSERIFKLLDTDTEIKDPENPLPLDKVKGKIEFKKVSFSYDGKEEVIKNLSFKVEAGKKVAIVGATGAGKTTIINLLCRYYDPQQGNILIDGIDIKNVSKRDLRRKIGLVHQDVFIFTGSIEENICLGRKGINIENLPILKNEENGLFWMREFPKGHKTDLSERGSDISLGQKQLISIARAMAYDPDIIVLDEATSSVDTETEIKVQQALEKLLAGKTAIIIAHRLSTVKNADKILVIHKGSLREEGTHQELLAKGGLYAKLYHLQFKDQETNIKENINFKEQKSAPI